MTFSRHCKERFDAVIDPYVSNWVVAGSKYTPSVRSDITAETVGYGSITTIRSSFSIAVFISFRRVWEFGAWPQNTIARRLSGWSIFSLSSRTPSIQRDTGMPLRFIRLFDLPSLPLSESKRPFSQSISSSQTRAQCFQAPADKP